MGRVNALASWLKKQGYFEPNFFRVHVLYFIFTILLTTIILWGSGANGNSNNEDARFSLSFIDALFLCTSAMTNSGLNTVNLSAITAFQQAILFILMLIGNITVVSTVTVLIRRHFIRKYMQEFLNHHEGGRKMLTEIDKEANGDLGSSTTETNRHTSTVRQRRSERQSKQTETPQAPSDWSVTRNLGSRFGALGGSVEDRPHHYLSFKPSVDHRVGLVQTALNNLA